MTFGVEERVKRGGPLRRLYDWTMREAKSKRAQFALAAVAFAESSFFPLPPDVMLIPMALADRRRAYWLAALCTIASVLGGMLGYAIGAWLYDSLGQWLISVYGYGDDVEAFRKAYQDWGAWIILIKGVTPIPYKIVTITSGFAAYDFPMFVILSVITRGARFFITAALLHRYGEPIRGFIEKRLGLAMFIVFAVVVAGFLAARYLI